jgi:hypothetical protein
LRARAFGGGNGPRAARTVRVPFARIIEFGPLATESIGELIRAICGIEVDALNPCPFRNGNLIFIFHAKMARTDRAK